MATAKPPKSTEECERSPTPDGGGANGHATSRSVLESEAESGGKVTFEMAAALGSDVAAHAKLYTWPYDLRPETR